MAISDRLRRPALAACVAVAAVASTAGQTLAAQIPAPPTSTPPARPCENDPNYRKFDFWVGEWDVQRTGVPRAPVGASSRVERQLDGCVLIEHWAPSTGAHGKSFNIYNRATKRWEQYWVDATGRITHYAGDFKDGTLYYEATQFESSNRIRMTFENKGPREVRQFGEISKDNGQTWTITFDLTYLRRN